MHSNGALNLLTDEQNSVVTDDEDLEVTREGLFAKLAGKAKEATGSLIGNDDLVREGRQQQAEVDTEAAHHASEAEDHDDATGIAPRADQK
jgi:uncharacterized protein YjbJ (UPF0337 family)